MKSQQILEKALKLDFLSAVEGIFLYENTPTAELMFVADELRKKPYQIILLLGKLIETLIQLMRA